MTTRNGRRRERIAAALLCGYAAAALVIKAARPVDGEIFPLFSWSLFSTVPAQDENYGVRLLAVRGAPLATPTFFEEARGLVAEPESIAAFMTVQRLGVALSTDNARDAAAARRLLERHHLRGLDDVRYEVVRRRFDTLERWSTGALRSSEVVAVLHSTSPTSPPTGAP